MSAQSIKYRIRTLYATAAELALANPVLLEGEPSTESDTGVKKIGDGVTSYNSLPAEAGGASALNDLTDVVITAPSTNQVIKFNGTNWINGAEAGGGVTDGDKGDITVSASGATWTIDNGAVTLAKLANLSSQRIVGRNTAGAGAPQEVTLSQLLDWSSSTQGSLLYRGASGWVALAPGTLGQTLQSGGAGGNLSWLTPTGGGNAQTANPLSQFASTTSAQFLGVISDETGTGLVVANNGPTLIAPILGTPASGTLTNCSGLPWTSGITGKPTTLSGYGITDAQPLDADLTAIAALTTTSFGRSFLDRANAAAGRTLLELDSLGTKTLARFTPRDNQPPAANFATVDTRNSVIVLEFDASTEETARFIGSIPEGADLASGLLVRIWWMGDTATSGNVRWAVAFEESGTDLDSDSFDTATEITSAASATSGIETVASITCTNIDSLSAGDRFRLRIARKATDAVNDTMLGDAQLVAVEVRGVA